MHGLKIVRTKHEDDERERRIDFDALLDSGQPAPSRFERIVPDRSTPIQAVFDHAHRKAVTHQLPLQNAGPSLFEQKPAPGAGNNAPGQRVAIDQNLFHRVRLDPRIPPRMPRKICLPS
jgi:hypothetical protein